MTQAYSTDFNLSQPPVAIIGGGLAGCECALTLAKSGIKCIIYEQKPLIFSPAHVSPQLGELVCSNSFRSNDAATSGVGLLKEEMRDLESSIMAVAEHTCVPAGKALAVDRERFSTALTALVEENPHIFVERREIRDLADPALEGKIVVVAAGPLASAALTASLASLLPQEGGKEQLYFYDAIAPIISGDSVDSTIAFRGSRYGNDGPPLPYSDEVQPGTVQPQPDSVGDSVLEGEGDYLNCPMTRQEYELFFQALLKAEKVPAHDFEKEIHFEGCMPIEALAERGDRTLTFGPLKPVGFTDPRTGRRPYALLQLRAENRARSAYNLVGCQTKMTYPAQAEVFRLIPGLAQAEFLRFGSVHRNTYVNAPRCLEADLSLTGHPHIFLAGQITGVEGYVESAATGLWLGLVLAAKFHKETLLPPPPVTALGALLSHLQTPAKQFQPSNIHFGLMPELSEPAHKKNRKKMLADRARQAFGMWRVETAG